MGIRLDLLHRVTDEELWELSERNPGYQFERTAGREADCDSHRRRERTA
jgi:hypothetical protein